MRDTYGKLYDLVLTLVSRFPRALGRTELMKLVYLVDSEHFLLYGRSLTGLAYKRDQRGPVNYAVVDIAECLADDQMIDIEKYITIYGRERYSHSALPKALEHQATFTQDEWSVIDAILWLTNAWSPGQIIERAYNTGPMRRILEQEQATSSGFLQGEAVPMDELRRNKPRFTIEELRETLRRRDLTIRPMTLEALAEYAELSEELRPYRERAFHAVDHRRE